MLEYCLHLLVIICAVSTVSGCRCGIIEERDRYCQADFASIVRVLGEGKLINERMYMISVERNLKPAVPHYAVISNKVYTATSSSLCGVQLERGNTYLIAGNYQNLDNGFKKQFLGLCSIARKLTSDQVQTYTPPKC